MSAFVLTPAQVAAFRLVAEAAPRPFVAHVGRGGAALETALWDLERIGLVMPAGRGWKLTPNGEARRPELAPFAGAGR